MDLYNNISNMKKCLIVFLIGISIVFSGCSKLSEPNNIDNPEILSWVWTHLGVFTHLGYDNSGRVSKMYKNLKSEFIEKVREREIKAAGFERIGALGNEVLTYCLEDEGNYESWKEFYHVPGSESEIESKIDNLCRLIEGGYNYTEIDVDSNGPKYKNKNKNPLKEGGYEYLYNNKEQTAELLKNLLWSFYRESGELVQERFKVLNWELDADNQGNGYTGYDIEYEVGDGWYVLLLLIEYDDDSKYEVNIIYSGTSLAEMNTYYQ